MNLPSSYQVVAILKKAGYSAYRQGHRGFKVWSSMGRPPFIAQYGYPRADERNAALDAYADVLAAAGITTERVAHMLQVTGREAA